VPSGKDVLPELALCLPCRTIGGDWHLLLLIRDHFGVSVSNDNNDVDYDNHSRPTSSRVGAAAAAAAAAAVVVVHYNVWYAVTR